MANHENADHAAILHERIGKLEYIEQMLRELRGLVGDLESPTLAYLLEMATLEAGDTLKAARTESGLFSRRR